MSILDNIDKPDPPNAAKAARLPAIGTGEAYQAGYREGYDNALAEAQLDRAPASRQLLNITKAALESAERECETIRHDTIEQCARVAESKTADAAYPLIPEIGRQVAAAIRALK